MLHSHFIKTFIGLVPCHDGDWNAVGNKSQSGKNSSSYTIEPPTATKIKWG